MKKTLVAAGVVIALGIVWTGGAWYTGKKLENHLAEMVTQANEQLKRTAPEAGVELSYQNYQRGVFSSHLQLVVKTGCRRRHYLVETRAKHCAGRVRFTWPLPARPAQNAQSDPFYGVGKNHPGE